MQSLIEKLNNFKLPLLALCGLGFALFFALNKKPLVKQAPLVTPALNPYEDAVAGIGFIEPKTDFLVLSTSLSGIVRDIYVHEGQIVKTGDPLYSLDQREINAQIEVLKKQLESAKIEYEHYEKVFRRIKELNASGALSQDEYDTRMYSFNKAQAAYELVQAQLNQALVMKQLHTTTAPIPGTIIDVSLDKGKFLSSSSLEAPMTMGDLSQLYLQVEIDEEYAPYISDKAPAKAFEKENTIKGYELKFIGKEHYVEPKKNLSTGNQRVDTRILKLLYALPPEAHHLFPGQQLDVFIKKDGHE